MRPHPALNHALAGQRAAELRRASPAGAPRGFHHSRVVSLSAARRGAGWLLVDVGLRLALPGPALERPIARVSR